MSDTKTLSVNRVLNKTHYQENICQKYALKASHKTFFNFGV